MADTGLGERDAHFVRKLVLVEWFADNVAFSDPGERGMMGIAGDVEGRHERLRRVRLPGDIGAALPLSRMDLATKKKTPRVLFFLGGSSRSRDFR
jgi:hypothetical protein